MHPTDEELVAAYLERDDQRAFGLLVERHQDQVYGYLMGMVRDRATADDLFQETFLRVVQAMQRRRGSYTRQGRWLGWVMRIARNATIDHMRRRKKWADVEAGDDPGDRSFWDQLPDAEPLADERLLQSERKDWVDAFIQQLSPVQREVLLLRQETDLTFREIAELTDVSINTALGRMRYALKNLERMIESSNKNALADLNNA